MSADRTNPQNDKGARDATANPNVSPERLSDASDGIDYPADRGEGHPADVIEGPASAPAFPPTLTITRWASQRDNVGRQDTLTWDELAKELADHKLGQKEGPAISGATFNGTRGADTIASRTVITLDIETNKKTGAVPDALPTIAEALGRKGYAAVIYSTHSHTEQDPRCRVVIRINKPVQAPTDPVLLEDWREIDAVAVILVARHLSLAGVLDTTKCFAESLFYTPRHALEADYYSKVIEGKPITYEAWLYDAGKLLKQKREQDELEREQVRKERASKPRRDGVSVIEQFNDKHSLFELLTKYGYTQSRRSTDWRSPYQSTKSFATMTYPDGSWVSLSGSDDAAGIGHKSKKGFRSGDAFDLYCHYEHNNDFNKAIKAAAAELGIPWVDPDRRPQIHYDPTAPKRMAEEAEAALLASGITYYQQSGRLIRPRRLPEDNDDDGVKRKAGSLILKVVNPIWIQMMMAETIRWVRKNKKDDKLASTVLPMTVPNAYMECDWKAPVLKGVVTTPTIYKGDGGNFVLLQTPGYDKASGLLYEPSAKFPPIPVKPTKQFARLALDRILSPLEGFPFVPSGDLPVGWTPEPDQGTQPSANRSVYLSALLTGLIRRTMRAAPVHAFDAVSAGTGKSKLAAMVSIILTGHEPASMPWVRDEDEQRKRIITTLEKGDLVLLFENVGRGMLIGGTTFDMLTTEPFMKDRRLGKNEEIEVPTNCLVLMTGNNMGFEGDTTRRVARCKMNAGVERPQDRQFDFEPIELVKENRPQMVVDCLTVLLAYIAAGQPLEGKVAKVGSYEKDWTFIREALVWLGEPDPADTMKEISATDPIADKGRLLMTAWDLNFGDRPMRCQTVIDAAKEGAVKFNEHSIPFYYKQLAEAVASIHDGKPYDAGTLGRWLKSYEGVIREGRQFNQVGNKETGTGSLIRLVSPPPADGRPRGLIFMTPEQREDCIKRYAHEQEIEAMKNFEEDRPL